MAWYCDRGVGAKYYIGIQNDKQYTRKYKSIDLAIYYNVLESIAVGFSTQYPFLY